MWFGRRQREDIDRRTLDDMNKVYAFADRDLALALRHEFRNRHRPLEPAALLGFFVEACWDAFWAPATVARKRDSLADFREQALQRIDRLALRRGLIATATATTTTAAAGQDARDAALSAYDAYGAAFALDLERLQLFPDAHTRLAETAALAAARLFRGDGDIDRAGPMLIGRLHGYMRAAVWHVEQRKR